MEILRKGWAVQSRLHAVRLYGGGEPELQRPPPCVRHQVPADPTTRFVEDRQKAEGDGCGFGRMVHGVTLESRSPGSQSQIQGADARPSIGPGSLGPSPGSASGGVRWGFETRVVLSAYLSS